MELHFHEKDDLSNKKRVSFDYDNNDDDVVDIGYVDENSNFIVQPTQNIKPNNIPNVGRFKTVNQPKPTRINAPLDASIVTQKPPIQPVKKKQISYDDILNSMSMRVGTDGKLQMHSQKLQEHQMQNHHQTQNQNQSQNQNIRKLYQVQQQHNYYQQQPYQQEEEEPQQPQIPLTKKQYKQLVVLDLIRRQQEKIRLSQVKSTKLLFPNSNVRIATAPVQQGINLNHIFRLK